MSLRSARCTRNDRKMMRKIRLALRARKPMCMQPVVHSHTAKGRGFGRGTFNEPEALGNQFRLSMSHPLLISSSDYFRPGNQ